MYRPWLFGFFTFIFKFTCFHTEWTLLGKLNTEKSRLKPAGINKVGHFLRQFYLVKCGYYSKSGYYSRAGLKCEFTVYVYEIWNSCALRANLKIMQIFIGSMRIMIMKESHSDLLIAPIFREWILFFLFLSSKQPFSFGGPQIVKIFFFQHHWNHACFLICKRFAITAHPQLTVLRNLKMSDLIVRVS